MTPPDPGPPGRTGVSAQTGALTGFGSVGGGIPQPGARASEDADSPARLALQAELVCFSLHPNWWQRWRWRPRLHDFGMTGEAEARREAWDRETAAASAVMAARAAALSSRQESD